MVRVDMSLAIVLLRDAVVRCHRPALARAAFSRRNIRIHVKAAVQSLPSARPCNHIRADACIAMRNRVTSKEQSRNPENQLLMRTRRGCNWSRRVGSRRNLKAYSGGRIIR